MEKFNLIEGLSFGQRVAEDEPSLEDYFVETPLWRKIIRNEVDVVYGPKGSGKSAIFRLLTSPSRNLENVLIVSAENPRGTTIFSAIKSDPPTAEVEFIYLWKLYILSMVANTREVVEQLKIKYPDLLKVLEEVGVIGGNKEKILGKILSYIDSVKISEVEVGLKAPSKRENRLNPEEIFSILDGVLSEIGKSVWVVFDRLDSVFDEQLLLEENALRALFKAYLDLLKFRKIQLKIFLRSDIWVRLTNRGFREASHITRSANIEWSEAGIVNLICKRLLSNQALVEYLSLNRDEIISDYEKQKELFYKIYPKQINAGSKKPDTVSWMVSRVADGTKKAAPRELIHLLIETKDEQVKSMEIGELPLSEESFFSAASIEKALKVVSKVRLEQTVLAEYPDMRDYILDLDSEKTQHSIKTLSKIWKINEEEAMPIATRLVDIGLFEVRGEKNSPEYWVPFLYRSALNLSQGRAEEE